MISTLYPKARSTETDGQLLHRFMEQHAEAAFAELMHRHGALVFGLARRLLGSATDAEDVYQATFLLLARKAPRLRRERSLAGWLYGVTRRLAADLRKQQRRRLQREQTASLQRQETSASVASESLQQSQEALRLLDIELNRLAYPMREPLVLHCLEGLSHQQIADRLGIAMGTVASRLHRARQLLKDRLLQRGVSLAMILALYSGVAQARLVPPALNSAAISAALTKTSVGTLVTNGALTLFTGEIRMIWLKQLQLTAAAIVAGGITLFAATNVPAAPQGGLGPPGLTAAPLKADDELAKLQGTWHCIAVIPGGENRPPDEAVKAMSQLQLLIKDDTITTKNAPNGDKQNTLRLDTKASPKRLEIISGKSVDLRALYMLEGDVLVLTFQGVKEEFPATMAVTKDLQGGMLVLQKIPYYLTPALDDPDSLKLKAAARKLVVQSNMRQIGLAFHNYMNDHNKFPRNIVDSNGKVILSWRVALLPYLQQDALYRQFNLDEPWDSEHNKPLMRLMPKTFATDDASLKSFTTPFRAFVGNGSAFENNKDIRPADIVDGFSNTIMFVEAEKAVPWSKPEEIDFQPNQPLPKLGSRFGDEFQVVMLDGSARSIPAHTGQDVIKALITRAGGELPQIPDNRQGTKP